jgi:hypothetical protein
MNGITVVCSSARGGEADAGDVASVMRGAQQPGQQLAAALSIAPPQRADSSGCLPKLNSSRQQLLAPSARRYCLGCALAGQRDHFVALGREHVDRNRADAAGGAGHAIGPSAGSGH